MKAIEGEQSHMDKILDQLEGQVGGSRVWVAFGPVD